VRIAGPGALCDGVVALEPRLLLGPTCVLRARFQLISAPPPVALGVGTSAIDRHRDLVVQRGPLVGPGTDAVGITLYAENGTPLERALLSTSAAAYLAATPVIELELSAAPDGSGASIPHGRYRLCPVAGCSAGTPLLDLPYDVPTPGGITGDAVWTASFFADGAAYTIDLLDWSLDDAVTDEFDVGPEPRVAYHPSCASIRREAGTLLATPTEPAACDGAVAVASVVAPGPADIQATFAWSVPPPCTDGFGVALAASPEASPFGDGAYAFLRRGPIPGVGDDALAIVVEDESTDPAAVGWTELHVLSSTPDLPAPADSIEIRLEAARDGAAGPLFPHAMVRTCLGTDCAATPFVDLEPYSFPQDDPSLRVCDRTAAQHAHPLDDGAIDPAAALEPFLLFAPEPTTLAAETLAVLALLGKVARRRRSFARSVRRPKMNLGAPTTADTPVSAVASEASGQTP
jgi:hypothetical protein